MYVIFIIVSIAICFGFSVIYKKKQDRITQQFLQEEREQYLQENLDDLKQKLEEESIKTKEKLSQETEQLKREKMREVERINQQLETMRKLYANYEESEKEKVKAEIKNYEEKERIKIQEKLDEDLAKSAEASQKAASALFQLKEELADFQEKQKAINKEIMRRREMEEKKDFYRIILQPESLSDIEILRQTRRNLKKPEIIDKVIYDNYIAKPVLEMVKRVLQNTTYCGIYKITCLTTGEIYIGKSTDIKSRWQQHCKSAFNCGTIASSLLHTKMKQYGIENFTFELLEKVPKENLSEREKYYINFYQTKEVGLNERNG